MGISITDSSTNKALVTGASGFVGSALCAQLAELKWPTRVLLRDIAKRVNLTATADFDTYIGDTGDVAELARACADIDTVFHLAGEAHVVKSGSTRSLTSAAAAKNLLEATIGQGVRRIVVLSSSLAQAAQVNEGDVTAYGRDKLEAENCFKEAAGKGEIEVVILRSVNVYGIGMKGNIAAMIGLIHRGRLPRLPRLSNRLSLVAVADLVRALILAAKSIEANGKTYLVTDGEAYAISEIEQAIYRCLGKRLPARRTPAMVLYAASLTAGLLSQLGIRKSGISGRTYRNLTSENLFNNEAICTELGFRPTTTLYEQLPAIGRNIVDVMAAESGQEQ
jgi:UDP-glucose 4-epimerase